MRRKITDIHNDILSQKKWIKKAGGTLSGYIACYGDPGKAPLDKNGEEEIIELPYLGKEFGMRPVLNKPGWYYKQHFGDGGTAIFNADMQKLHDLEFELEKAIELENRTRNKRGIANDS